MAWQMCAAVRVSRCCCCQIGCHRSSGAITSYVFAAVTKNASALKYASVELKRYRKVVLPAVKNLGYLRTGICVQ